MSKITGKKKPKAQKRKGWTTDAQFSYLDGLIPTFKTAQANNTTQDMWVPIENHWFSHWPLPLPSAAEVAEGLSDEDRRKKVMDRIKSWFGNHARSTSKTSGSRDVLDLRERKPKKRTVVQAYQRLYNETKIKPLVTERWNAKHEYEKTHPPIPPALPLPKYPPVNFRNDIAKELYEAESDEVKAQVEEFRDNPHATVDDSEDDEDDSVDDIDEVEIRRVHEAKRMQKAQRAAINTLGKALGQVEREAGMIGVVVLAGPDPEHGGSIRVISIAQGENAMGHGFLDLYGPNWAQYVEGPMGDFSDEVYSADSRADLALPGSEPTERAASTFNWRYLSGDLTKPKIGFARGASSTPAGTGSRAGSRPPAISRLLSVPPSATQNATQLHGPLPSKSLPSPPPTSGEPLAQSTSPKTLISSSAPPTAIQSLTQPSAAGSRPPPTLELLSVPPTTTQSAAQPPMPAPASHSPAPSTTAQCSAELPAPPSSASKTAAECEAAPKGHTREDIAIEKPANNQGRQEGDEKSLKVTEDVRREDSIISYTLDDQDTAAAGGSDDIDDVNMDETDDVPSPSSDKQNDDMGAPANADQMWDNGEPLTEVERAHLLTIDAFSRAEEMKRRRRTRLEKEESIRKERELEANWDNGLSLTVEEREKMMKLPIKERSREMNIRRTNEIKARAAEKRPAHNVDNKQPQAHAAENHLASKVDNKQPHNSNSMTGGDYVSPGLERSISTATSIASTHPHIESWPSWIKDCVPELEKLHDSSAWKLVIWEWLELEHAMGYPSGKGKKFTLTKNNRPHEIGDWFQYGRRGWDKQPLIAKDDIDRYSTEWWQWWSELQPPSRASKDPCHMPRVPPHDNEWPEIMKGTNNGLYIVLVGLGWWAQGAHFAKLDMKVWDEATADVSWVIDQMKHAVQHNRKRSRVDDKLSSDDTDSRPNSKRSKPSQ